MMFVGQHMTTLFHTLSRMFSWLHARVCFLKFFVVLEKGLVRCAEIGTIWLCFRTSVCSSRALRTNQTGQLDKECKWECLQVVALCGRRKGKQIHLCWTMDIKIILRFSVRVQEIVIKSSAKAWTCCMNFCICCINLCIWSGFCGRTSKLLKFHCKRESINKHRQTNCHFLNRKGNIQVPSTSLFWGCRTVQAEHNYTHIQVYKYTSQACSK